MPATQPSARAATATVSTQRWQRRGLPGQETTEAARAPTFVRLGLTDTDTPEALTSAGKTAVSATDHLKAWAKEVKRDAVTLWFAARHPGAPWYAKAIGVFVVAYALSPIDLIPDFIPVLGLPRRCDPVPRTDLVGHSHDSSSCLGGLPRQGRPLDEDRGPEAREPSRRGARPCRMGCMRLGAVALGHQALARCLG